MKDLVLLNRHNLCLKRIRNGEADCNKSCPLYSLRKGYETCSDAVSAKRQQAERILRENGQWEEEWL